jgi:diguanylate cyclase (GGDEF)-like protein
MSKVSTQKDFLLDSARGILFFIMTLFHKQIRKSDTHIRPDNLRPLEEALQTTLEKGFARLYFPEILETAYREKETRRQKRLFPPLGAGVLLLFLLYAIPDYFLIPDIYTEAWGLRFFIIAPFCTLILLAINSPKIQKNIDILMLIALLAGTLFIIFILIRSQSPMAAHYHTGILLSVIFLTIGTRIRFRLNLTGCLVIFLSYAAALPMITTMPTPAKLNSLLVLLTAIVLCLVGCYQMEYRQRRDYLETQMKKIDALRLSYANQKLTRLSLSDPLTGLGNRRHFDENLKRQWRMAARSGDCLSLLFMDVDNFKAYNDQYGHPAGDRCLQAIASILKTHSRRPSDLSARFGGEEFVLLLPHTTEDQALSIAESILEHMEKLAIPHAYSQVAPHITLSIGVATATPDPGTQALSLLTRADQALYQAKTQGKNRAVAG